MNYGDYKVKPKIRNSVSTERKFPSGKIYLKDGTEVIPKIQKWKFPSGDQNRRFCRIKLE